MSHESDCFDVAVVGGGPAGLSAALALARAGARTALIARRLPYADNRTTALLGASVDFLDSLEVWSRCASEAAALKVMRLVDVTGRLITVDGFSLTAAEGESFPRLEASFTVTTYLTPPEEGVTAGATPGAPASTEATPAATTTGGAP